MIGNGTRPFVIVALILAFVLIAALKMPFLLTDGRFWAEEGRVYFAAAWEGRWFDALVAAHSGYLSIVPNAATLLASRFASIETAPIVTALIALLVQTLAPILLAISAIPWLRNPLALAAAFALVLLAPIATEVWLNTITSQFHLVLCTGIILASEARRGWAGAVQGATIALASLNGPGVAFLTPVFALRAVLDRSGPRAGQAMLISAGTLVQLAIHFSAPRGIREIGIDPAVLIAIIYAKHVLLPVAGEDWTDSLTAPLPAMVSGGRWPIMATLAVSVAFGWLVVAAWRADRRHAAWLVASGMVIMPLSYAGALGVKSDLIYPAFVGARYAFAPVVLLNLALLGVAASPAISPSGRLSRALAGLCVIAAIVAGSSTYFRYPAMTSTGPDWRNEVALWRRDPSHKLLIWPFGWDMRLSYKPFRNRQLAPV